MPLMWVNSIGMCLLIVMMLINLYNLKDDYILEVVDNNNNNNNNMIKIKLEW